jgi:hypothetical protein
MKEQLIRGAMNWPKQKQDFVHDGTLRDIYVQHTTTGDWRVVVAMIFGGDYRARLDRAGVAVTMPTNVESLFAETEESELHHLDFEVGGVALQCHFFMPDEIELSFWPEAVTEAALHDLLAFMIDIGDATKKAVIMTPENWRQSPIFKYDPSVRELHYLPSG